MSDSARDKPQQFANGSACWNSYLVVVLVPHEQR